MTNLPQLFERKAQMRDNPPGPLLFLKGPELIDLTLRELQLIRDQHALIGFVIGPYKGREWALYAVTKRGYGLLRGARGKPRYFRIASLISFLREEFPEISIWSLCSTEADIMELSKNGSSPST